MDTSSTRSRLDAEAEKTARLTRFGVRLQKVDGSTGHAGVVSHPYAGVEDIRRALYAAHGIPLRAVRVSSPLPRVARSACGGARRPRGRRTHRARAPGGDSSGESDPPGGDDAGSRPRLRLVGPSPAIYAYGCLSAEARGEAGAEAIR